MFRALCAHHQEVEIVLYSIWYRHTLSVAVRCTGWDRTADLSQTVHRTANKILCIKLVNYWDYTEMYGQQNIKTYHINFILFHLLVTGSWDTSVSTVSRLGDGPFSFRIVQIHCGSHPGSYSMDRLQLKCDGTQWRTGGKVKGKLANGEDSPYSSHYLGTWCIQHYYRWCTHLGCQSSTELTPPPI